MSARDLPVIIDSRLRLPPGLPRTFLAAVKAEFTHANPDFHKAKAMGFATWGHEPRIATWRKDDDSPEPPISLPRGGTARLRSVASAHGYLIRWLDRRVRVADVDWPALRRPLRGYQEEAVAAALAREQGIVRMPTGCIAGDAEIGVNRAGRSFRISIADLVHRFNGGAIPMMRGRAEGRWDPEIPTRVRMRGEYGYVRLGRLIAAWESGIKMTYRVRTEDGREVRATLDHRFATEDGWKRLGQIGVGERIYVEGLRGGAGMRRRPDYKMVAGLRAHPYAGRRGVRPGKGGWSVPLHRLVMEAELSKIPIGEFVDRVRTGEVDGLVFLDPDRWSVHHADENPANNRPENLVLMGRREHLAMHAREEGWKHVAVPTVLSEIVSIERYGEEPTYDLEMEAPHSFLASGIVVHNSGKTTCAFAFAARTRQPALAIMRDRKLLDQWVDRAALDLGLARAEIGILRGGERLRLGPRLTLALQQTLYSRSFPLEEVAGRFGCVMVDEGHTVAAATFQRVIDVFAARYRVAFTADETRKDKKEFLVYDEIGDVVYEIERAELESQRVIVPVDALLLETGFEAPWYSMAEAGERDFNRLLDEMTGDDSRNALIVSLVEHLIETGQTPILAFTHRVEHARRLADELLFARGVRSGLMIGEKGYETRFAEDKARLARGDLPVAVGTLAAIGQGIDMPSVQSGILCTPIASNPQFFNQVRGRTCRPSPGKSAASLFVLWDRSIYSRLLRTISSWNDGRASEFELPAVA